MSKPIDLQANVERIISYGGLTLLARGAAAPADASTGYAPGCLFIDTTGAAVYINEGSATSSDFDAITTA